MNAEHTDTQSHLVFHLMTGRHIIITGPEEQVRAGLEEARRRLRGGRAANLAFLDFGHLIIRGAGIVAVEYIGPHSHT